MKFKLGLAQTKHSPSGPISVMENAAQIASDSFVDLLVFPESMMTSYETPFSDFIASAQPIDGPYVKKIQTIAQSSKLWIVTTMNERNPSPEGLPYNTAVIIDPQGLVRGFYRKVHMFDSYQTTESEKMCAGDSLFEPIDTPFCKLGLGICYDLRFPEVSRHAAIRKAELLLYPAAWLAGDCKIAQWETMLRSRAIENAMFVGGICRCDSRYIGHTTLFDPMGNCLGSCSTDEDILISEIDTELVSKTRKQMPVLEHLRPEVYGQE